MAFRLNGGSLMRAWAANVASPSAPIVVNGVVFALNTGSAAAPATLYAIDGSNGKELWNSGRTMKAASHTGLWSISGQVYVAGSDGMSTRLGRRRGGRDVLARVQATACSPFLATRERSFRDGPWGRFSPRSHWLTSPVVTLRYRAKTA